jgi:hypothetical protein
MQQWGSNPTLYAPVDFWKKIYGPPLCVYIYIFFLFLFFLWSWMEVQKLQIIGK